MARRGSPSSRQAAFEAEFPVVGVGASAGGLEAFTELLRHLPARTGMAYVLVQHLDPTHPSMLRQALARATSLPVVEAEDQMRVEPDHVYVIGPNVEMGIVGDRLQLSVPSAGARPRLPIDLFFRALSRERGRRAIGVVLTGAASDGTEGLRAIKAAGGLALVQDPDSARFSSMPRSAIAAGVVDAALPLPVLAAELVRLGHRPECFEAVKDTAPGTSAGAPIASAHSPARAAPHVATSGSLGGEAFGPSGVAHLLDRLLLARYAPPAVLVNDELDVLQFRGDTGDYLQHPPGAPSQNLAHLARSGLMPSLRRALLKAKKSALPVRVSGVEIDHGASRVTCDLVVVPFNGVPAATAPLFVVTFETPSRSAKSSAKKPPHAGAIDRASAARLQHLLQELGATKEYLAAVIEEHAHAADELASANEALSSGNVELQSLNEELETAKEELQSTNEELSTVNDELRSRNFDMSRVNAELSNLIDTVELPILILDTERRIRRFTPRARDLLNVRPSDVGRSLDDIRTDVDVPDLDARIGEVLRTETTSESEVTDRKGRWYRMRIRPYRTEDDRVDGVVISLVDIDALKQHIREAHEARVEAERANRTKDQFLAILSHELRTPLATMLMHTQLLRRGDLDGAKLQRACAAIERGTRVQAQLIDDLLDVSRIVSGKLHMSAEPTDLAAVVAASVEGVAAQAKEKLIDVDVDLGPSIRPVSGDRVRLQQVVSNLLTNAIKFTPKHGKVKVRVDVVDGAARIRVEDTGIGIAPAFLPHVFARFTQEDPSSTRVHGGLGLGLAIVRHIVEAHGGTIVAESPGPNLGATFTVCLPILGEDVPAPLRAPPPRPERQARGGELHDLKVLVVDDDAASRDAMVLSLEAAGAEVRTAEAAAGAVAAVEQFRPDVLVSDIAMPGDDGLNLIRRIRGLGGASGGDVPALALSALADAESHRRALCAGFQMHLAKPIDVDHLVDAVLELADRRSEPPSSGRASRPSSTP